jgi:hypothetical protein
MFTCGWAITEADEAAIATLPADAWKPGIRQDATSSRKYSITCTNIPDAGMPQVPGSHHPQFIDAVHRDHATVETDGARTAKAMGLRNLPSKSWQVNAGWVIAANIAAAA